jgi:anti-sigma factor RsiW
MTPDADHRELRPLLGAYLLGGLDSADRTRAEHHLGGCRDCEQELARLAPVAGMLSRLREREEPALAGPMSADLLPSLVDKAGRERRALHRRTILAAVAVAVAVIAAVIAMPRIGSAPERPAAATVALRPAAGYDTVGSATLTAKPWGTAMTLQLEGMPPSGPFRLEVTGPGGSSEVTATWGETPTGAAVVSAATALTPEEVHVIRVVGAAGTVLEGAHRDGD